VRCFLIGIAVAGSTLAAPHTGRAQVAEESREVMVGTRVRIFAPDLRSDRYVGRIDSLAGGVVVLDTAGLRHRFGFDMGPVLVDEYRRVTIRVASIQRMEVSGGRTVGGSTLRGALLGALSGGLLFGLGNMPQVNPTAQDFLEQAPLGLAVGAVVGGVVGWALGGEAWLPARVPR
jgi:hypothetical protein